MIQHNHLLDVMQRPGDIYMIPERRIRRREFRRHCAQRCAGQRENVELMCAFLLVEEPHGIVHEAIIDAGKRQRFDLRRMTCARQYT